MEVLDTHGSYFKFNLAAINLYNLVRLEEPRSRYLRHYRHAYGILRSAVRSHGNAHFNMIDRELNGADAARDQETIDYWMAGSNVLTMISLLICASLPGTSPPAALLTTVGATSFRWRNASAQTFSGSAVPFCSSVVALEPSKAPASTSSCPTGGRAITKFCGELPLVSFSAPS